MRDLYLNMLTQCKFELLYYEAYFRHACKMDNFIKIFLAIMTADFVANWAIWKTYTDIWAIGIAVSQVLQLINGLIPYSKRIETLGPLHKTLELLYADMENSFIDIISGKVDFDKANDLRTKYQKEWDELENTALLKDSIPRVPWLVKKSDQEKVRYFKTLVGDEAINVKSELIESIFPFSKEKVTIPLSAQTRSFRMPSQMTTLSLDKDKVSIN